MADDWESSHKDMRRRDKFERGQKAGATGRGKRGHDKPKFDDRQNMLIKIWEDTVGYFQARRTKIPPSELITISELEEPDPCDNPNKLILDIRNADTFEMAIDFIAEDLNPLVLNMASDFKPGGGVRSGKMAQEEELFRRSNAHLTHPQQWYPLTEDQVIYSPEVTIVRDTAKNNYAFIKEHTVAMIACAAVRKPRLIYGEYKDRDYDEMYSKIESLFLIGIEKEHDSLVLGALGCGAFGNPPEEVAKIFKIMIDKYGSYFKKIGFAILVAKPGDDENLIAFQKILSDE